MAVEVQSLSHRPVILAWEQGSNYGHVLRQREILRILQSQGLPVIWALSEVLASPYAQYLKSVVCTKVVVRNPPRTAGFRIHTLAASFANVLSAQGWTERDWLTSALRAWLTLLRSVKPQFVVLDYAPVAQMAAYFLGIPALHISSGFDAPPASCPLFIGHDLNLVAPEVDTSIKASIEACIDEAAQANSIALSTRRYSLADVLAAPLMLLDCLPQTDPYGFRRDATYAPFFARAENGNNSEWPLIGSKSPQDKVFVYVRDQRIAHALLCLLGDRDVVVLCVWPNYNEHLHGRLPPNIRVCTHAVDLGSVLRDALLLVNYGSVGVSSLGVIAGVPQLIVPTDVEKKMVATRISEQRLGLAVTSSLYGSELTNGLDKILNKSEHRANCKNTQMHYLKCIHEHDFESNVLLKVWELQSMNR